MLLELITSDQIRAARALLKWSAKDLASHSGVGISTIKRLELMDGVPVAQTRILASIHNTLRTAGIEFIGAPDDGPGVRLRGRVDP